MGSFIRKSVETLVRELQTDVLEHTVLVPPNEYYEIKHMPSLLVIGPKMEENRAKRVSEKIIVIDRDALTYTERNWPRFYHLDFDFVLTAGNGMELLELQESLISFFLDNIAVSVPIAAGWGLGPFGVEPWGNEDGSHRRAGASEPV